MNKVLEDLGKIGIIPVIKIDDPEKAAPLAKALLAGGIPCAEVTFRTAQGEEAIRRIAAEVPQVLVGAGTVLTTDQVDRAIKAGAKYIVSPGLNPKVVAYCISKGIPITPGCSNPSDIELALEAGLEVVKFFPAEQAGGLDYIKAIAAPYPSLKFIPTGGINASNIGKYIAYNAGDFARITALAHEAVINIHGFSVVHFGINAKAADAAAKGAALFNSLFGFPLKDGNSSVFAGDYIEIMKLPTASGANGHIAIGTNSIVRAQAYLEGLGIAFDPSSVKTGSDGQKTVIFARDEILGFSWHLIQKK